MKRYGRSGLFGNRLRFGKTVLLFICALAFAAACGDKAGGVRPGSGGGGGVGVGGSGAGYGSAGYGSNGGAGIGSGAAGMLATAGTFAPDPDGGVPLHADFDAGTDPARNNVIAGNICDRLATIQCAGEQHCCDAPNRTFDQCKAEMQQGCTDMAALDGIANQPVAAFDAAFAATAFTTYETMASMCDQNVTEWGSAYTGLLGIFKGTIAATKSCTPKGNLQDRGVIGGYLASCLDIASYACQPRLSGTSTLPIPSNWTCDAKSAVGARCFTDVNCMDGLYCDNPDGKIGNVTCKQRKADGAACVNPNECASLFCKKGLCVPKSVQAAYCLRND